jgi:hypothetical protein
MFCWKASSPVAVDVVPPTMGVYVPLKIDRVIGSCAKAVLKLPQTIMDKRKSFLMIKD